MFGIKVLFCILFSFLVFILYTTNNVLSYISLLLLLFLFVLWKNNEDKTIYRISKLEKKVDELNERLNENDL